MGLWSTVNDGTAIGPSIYVEGKHGRVTYTALWSDEEGVLVSIDHRGEFLVLPEELAEHRSAVDQLMGTQPPLVATQLGAEI